MRRRPGSSDANLGPVELGSTNFSSSPAIGRHRTTCFCKAAGPELLSCRCRRNLTVRSQSWLCGAVRAAKLEKAADAALQTQPESHGSALVLELALAALPQESCQGLGPDSQSVTAWPGAGLALVSHGPVRVGPFEKNRGRNIQSPGQAGSAA